MPATQRHGSRIRRIYMTWICDGYTAGQAANLVALALADLHSVGRDWTIEQVETLLFLRAAWGAGWFRG